MKESEKWLALCDPNCQFKRHFPNCVCCDIALEYKRCKSEEQADKEGEGMNKPTLCDRCDNAPFCLLNFDGKPCRKVRTVEPTNYDLLISKTPEEMAKWIVEIADCHECEEMHGFRMCATAPGKACEDCWAGWLKSPARGGKG